MGDVCARVCVVGRVGTCVGVCVSSVVCGEGCVWRGGRPLRYIQRGRQGGSRALWGGPELRGNGKKRENKGPAGWVAQQRRNKKEIRKKAGSAGLGGSQGA